MSKYPGWPTEKSARAFSMRLDGYSYAEIADALGCSRSSVAGYMHRHGVKPGELHREGGRSSKPGGYNDFQAPAYRRNDDNLHLTLMLASLRQTSVAAE